MPLPQPPSRNDSILGRVGVGQGMCHATGQAAWAWVAAKSPSPGQQWPGPAPYAGAGSDPAGSLQSLPWTQCRRCPWPLCGASPPGFSLPRAGRGARQSLGPHLHLPPQRQKTTYSMYPKAEPTPITSSAPPVSTLYSSPVVSACLPALAYSAVGICQMSPQAQACPAWFW